MRETAYAKINLALRARNPLYTLSLLVLATGCDGSESETAPPMAISSLDEACEATTQALVENGYFSASQIAGCDGGKDSGQPGFYLLRVNAYCHQEICGSVLLGWYGVDEVTGQVHDWDYDEWTPVGPLMPEGSAPTSEKKLANPPQSAGGDE